MDVAVAAVGRLKPGPEQELCRRYFDRARKGGRSLGLSGFEVDEIRESRAVRAADRIAEEEKALLERIGSAGRLICLDAGGELLDSAGLAAMLARDAAATVSKTVFVIGGPDGLGAVIRKRSERTISFGRMTWPHQIVRILLAEQLYRATTILSGHPYHRA